MRRCGPFEPKWSASAIADAIADSDAESAIHSDEELVARVIKLGRKGA